MFFENNYIIFNNKLNINSISSYKVIMTKFINKYINIYKDNYPENSNQLLNDSLIYSKYYLYYKSINCTYSNEIMEILYNIDHFSSYN
jgi:hypothetical protein